jgi:hypothetical protein
VLRRVVCYPVVRLLVVITAILGNGHSSAHAQESPIVGLGTPHLIFSTCLGGSKPCEGCSDARTFAQNAGSDVPGRERCGGRGEQCFRS